MDKVRDIEKYVYDYFYNHFDIASYFDAKRDFDQEKIFRQIIDIEYYLQKNINENNLILFDQKEFKLPIGIFKIDFGNESITFQKTNSYSMWETFCVSSTRFVTNSTSSSSLYISYDKDVNKLSIFPAYCLSAGFFIVNHINSIKYKKTQAIEECYKKVHKDKIDSLSKNIPPQSFEIHFFKQHADEKSYMILGYNSQDKLCRQHRALLIKNGKPIKKIVFITDCLDIFIDNKNVQKDITYISWDHPHVKISELNWDILKGCHVFYILTEHSNRNLEDVYKTSVEVKKELDKIEIKNFRYVFLPRNIKPNGQLMRTRPMPYIYSYEEYQFTKSPPAQSSIKNLKQYTAQLARTQETLLCPYFKTGTATLIYENQEVDKTFFALLLAHSMRLGQCAFKGWRESKKSSSGIYFFNNRMNTQTQNYVRDLSSNVEKIFYERNKYKKKMLGYMYPVALPICDNNYDYMPDKADFIKKNIRNSDSIGFIVFDNVYSSADFLPEQNILVRELTDAGWCVIIVANWDTMPEKNMSQKFDKKLYLQTMTTIDTVIELSPQKPALFGNRRLKINIESSKIVPRGKRKNITCEFDLCPKRPTCCQVSQKKRRKFTKKEREKLKTKIKEIAYKVSEMSDEEFARGRDEISDKGIAENLKISTNMVKKLRRELNLGRYKGRFTTTIDHKHYSFRLNK